MGKSAVALYVSGAAALKVTGDIQGHVDISGGSKSLVLSMFLGRQKLKLHLVTMFMFLPRQAVKSAVPRVMAWMFHLLKFLLGGFIGVVVVGFGGLGTPPRIIFSFGSQMEVIIILSMCCW